MSRAKSFRLLARCCGVVSCAVIALLAVAPAPALERKSWTIANFEVVLAVEPDGTLRVTETIQPRFVGAWNGIYRTVPVDYRTPTGFDYKLFLKLESVRDEFGRELRCESSRERGYRKLKIWIPGAQDTTKTVVITYQVENALRYLDDHDELYWNATGTEWPVGIERASAHVRLPAAAAGNVRAIAFTGPWGSTRSEADVTIRDNEVYFSTRAPLDFREGLTLVVGWNKGVVAEPTPVQRASQFLRSNWIFLLPIFTFLGMFSLWYTRGRDPRLERAIMPLYAPPEALTPAEVGMLADNNADLRDITATLVDLAVRGYLLIEETEKDVLFWTRKDYLFQLKVPRNEWRGLKSHELELLDALFGASGDRVQLSSLENKFYKRLPELRRALAGELIRKGYYTEDPQRVKKTWLGLGIAVLVVTFFAASAAHIVGISPVSTAVAFIISGIVVILFGRQMPARTRRGTRAWADVLGFEEFLSRAEKDRLERLVTTPELFEKYLPYAMALGVERHWTHAFEDIYQRPPEWYRGRYPGAFRPSLLVNDLNTLGSRAAATFTSAPRSSGGSGFGGGGFSGGGFGGGGGGAF